MMGGLLFCDWVIKKCVLFSLKITRYNKVANRKKEREIKKMEVKNYGTFKFIRMERVGGTCFRMWGCHRGPRSLYPMLMRSCRNTACIVEAVMSGVLSR